jgi:hypothetical protein
MHAAVRVVRTIAFLSVVMPNARSPHCYASRFPPVPDGMWEYFMAGSKAIRGSGGCNDLILRCAGMFHHMWSSLHVTADLHIVHQF